ncbi:MORN repeat-containing protein 1 [Pelodytes ibericus]
MAAPTTMKKTSLHYVGDVKKQLRHGYGIYVYPNSYFRYEGEWKAGKKHGLGKLLLKDGSYYEGEFVDGEITGNGSQYWASSGNKYSGEFQNGEIHGYGVMQYKDGGRCEGEFVFGIREGHGLLVDNKGQTYRGSFHKNKKNGEGQVKFKNGDHFEGDWLLDKRQGHGILHLADGTIYEGQWRNDVFNGQGAMIHCSGVIYDGLWINGHPAAAPKMMVILGEDIVDVVQGSPLTFHVELQNEEGEVVKNENGRALKISAGIKYVQLIKNQSTSFLELIEDFEEKPFQTPFGYECISYPLKHSAPGNQEQIDGLPVTDQSECESASTCVQSVRSEQVIDGQHGVGDGQYKLGENLRIYTTDDDASSPSASIRTEMGCVVFKDIMLGPPPAKILHLLTQAETDKNRGKKLSGIISAEKTEKMTVSQEKIEDSRSDPIIKERRSKKEQQMVDNNIVRPGTYIIMVEDITNPPFLGQTLPPAFQLIRVIPEKASTKINRKE